MNFYRVKYKLGDQTIQSIFALSLDRIFQHIGELKVKEIRDYTYELLWKYPVHKRVRQAVKKRL